MRHPQVPVLLSGLSQPLRLLSDHRHGSLLNRYHARSTAELHSLLNRYHARSTAELHSLLMSRDTRRTNSLQRSCSIKIPSQCRRG